MNQQIRAIRTQMTLYGAGLGVLGGGILGAGFAALIYNPLHDMNLLIVAVGAVATMLVGLVFGLVAGGLSGVSVAVLTALFFKRPRFRLLYNLLTTGVSVGVTTLIFFQTAYLIGRPFIYWTPGNQTWGWAWMVAITGAVIVSYLATNRYVTGRAVKVKVSP